MTSNGMPYLSVGKCSEAADSNWMCCPWCCLDQPLVQAGSHKENYQ